MGGKSQNKAAYFDKLKALLEEYKSIFIVGVDQCVSYLRHGALCPASGQPHPGA